MFLKIFCIVIFFSINVCSTFAQDSSDTVITNNLENQLTENVDNTEENTQSESFFDVLPTNENLQSDTQPAFLTDLENRNSNNNITSTFIRSIVGFIFFFAILYIIYKYLKKRSKNVLGSGDIIKVLATTTLGQNKSLSIVEIAGNIYFISITDKNINIMSEIVDKDTKDKIMHSHAKSSENIVEEPFSSMFDKALAMFNIKKNKDNITALDTTRDISEKIKTMNADTHNYTDDEESIPFHRINRYIDSGSTGNSSKIGIVTKKKTSKKSSKK